MGKRIYMNGMTEKTDYYSFKRLIENNFETELVDSSRNSRLIFHLSLQQVTLKYRKVADTDSSDSLAGIWLFGRPDQIGEVEKKVLDLIDS